MPWLRVDVNDGDAERCTACSETINRFDVFYEGSVPGRVGKSGSICKECGDAIIATHRAEMMRSFYG